MRLYTGTGDRGETSLPDGARRPKDDARIAAVGEVDELNAVLGWCRVVAPGSISPRLEQVQRELFTIGADLASPGDSARAKQVPRIQAEDARRLEAWIDEATAAVAPLRNFILAGGSEPACRLHIARACCRRAERSVVTLARSGSVRPDVLVYLNRLSDLCFAWARLANHEAGCPEIVWRAPE